MAAIISDRSLLDDAQKHGVCLGLKPVNGVVPRLDIDVMLVKHPLTFNLFLLALDALKKADPSEKMSYYQIAGIHGIPKQPWDGVDSIYKRDDDTPESKDESGYCPHGQWTFSTWHRPYLALYEQSLYAQMLEIAESFTVNRQEYVDSLRDFRLPYWDYFRPRGGVSRFPGVREGETTQYPWNFDIPQIFSLPEVMVRRPDGDGWDKIVNPLSAFSFMYNGKQILADEKWDHVGMQKDISRATTTRDKIETLNAAINKDRAPNWAQVRDQMTSELYNNFYAFGSNKFAEDAGLASGSVESVHDKYHGLIGSGPNHMGWIQVAAFDPIFWAHHAQIDRWIAIWQAIHPDDEHPESWFKPDEAEPWGPKSGLLPFRKTRTAESQTFWNSDEVKDVQTLGYTYPDLVKGGPDEVKKQFLAKYDWAGHADGTPPEDMQPLDLSEAMVYQYKKASPISALKGAAQLPITSLEPIRSTISQATTAISQTLTSSSISVPQVLHPTLPSGYMPGLEKSIEWYIDMKVEKQALNGSFGVYYFLGNNDIDPVDYKTAPNLAGFSFIFANSVQGCENCASQSVAQVKVANTTVITPILRDFVVIEQLQSLTPEHVLPYLEQNLRWRVATAAGVHILPARVSGLELSISAKSKVDGSDQPTYVRYPEIIDHINERITDPDYKIPTADLPAPA